MRIDNVKIEKLDHFGRGIIRDKGIIFVEDSLPGDVVDIEIVKDKKGIKEARVINFIERSPFYRDSVCPFEEKCGGCNLIKLEYEEQLKYKKEKVQELIDRMLKEDIQVRKVISSFKEFNYRNKITLHVKDKRIGLYQNNSNDLVEIDKCFLVSERINAIIKRLIDYLKKEDVLIYDIVIKTTSLNEDMLLINGRLDYEEFKKEFSDIKVIYINEQLVTKENSIKEKLLGKEFLISKSSFFQVNMFTTELLYKKVIDLVQRKKYKTCLDLYCGTGTISILVNDFIDRVYGIEVVRDAINDANKNKDLNNCQNIEFILGKVEDNLDKFNDIDLIIVDPPREGLNKKTRDNLKRIRANNIIYVSCDPATLMRDLGELKDIYKIEEISICDMFSNTYHVETIALLTKKIKK